MKREVGQGGCPTGRPGSGLKDLEINAAVLSSRRKVPVKSKAGMRSVDLKGLLDFEPDRYRDRERARSALRAERMTEMLTQSSAVNSGASRWRCVPRMMGR